MASMSGLTVLLGLVCALLVGAAAALLAVPKSQGVPCIFLITVSAVLALLLAGVHATHGCCSSRGGVHATHGCCSSRGGVHATHGCRPGSREHFEVSTQETEVLQGAMLQDACFYLSTLGKTGVVGSAWKNIAPSGAERDFMLQAVPSIQADTRALRLLNNPATGPESQFLGVQGDTNFTVAWHGAFPRLAGATTAFRHTLFEYYGNTQSNVGARIEVEGVPAEGSGGPLVFAVVFTQGRADMPPFVARWPIREVLAAPMTYAVSRDQGTVSLWIAGVKDFKEEGGAPVEAVLLSNRRARINPAGTLDADMQVVAMYSRACDRQFVEALDDYIRKRKNAISDTTQSLVREKQAAEGRKACPLVDPKVCANECAAIRDWTNPFDVMSSASTACKDRLVDYCAVFDNSKPDNICQGCFLTPAKDSERCRNMRAFLDTKQVSPANAALAAISGSNIVERLRNELVAGEPDLTRWYRNLVVGPAAPVGSAQPFANRGNVANVASRVAGTTGARPPPPLLGTVTEPAFISFKEASSGNARPAGAGIANIIPTTAGISSNGSPVVRMPAAARPAAQQQQQQAPQTAAPRSRPAPLLNGLGELVREMGISDAWVRSNVTDQRVMLEVLQRGLASGIQDMKLFAKSTAKLRKEPFLLDPVGVAPGKQLELRQAIFATLKDEEQNELKVNSVEFAAWTVWQMNPTSLWLTTGRVMSYCNRMHMDPREFFKYIRKNPEDPKLCLFHRLVDDLRDIDLMLAAARALPASVSASPELDATQNAAVAAMCRQGVSYLQGGAGTGKTTTCAVLLHSIVASCVCMAFTHKAKRCLASKIHAAGLGTKVSTVTIHSFIARWKVSEDVAPATVVLLDEASMVDIELLAELARILLTRFTAGYQLIFVGDDTQLPPIGRGQFFRERVAQRCGVLALTRCYRTDLADLYAAYQLIREGKLPPDSPNFRLLACVDDREINRVVGGLIRNFSVGKQQIIAWQNKDVFKLNKWVQEHRLARKEVGPDAWKGFYVGDAIVYVGENSEELTNAMTGRISAIVEKGVTVLWETGNSTTLNEEKDIVLSYCLTVHKAQGSEYDEVIVPCYDAEKMGQCLDRRWLYTAATRGRNRVTVLCTPAITASLSACIR
ncbi:hypothetical protein HXX76_014166 [Chlamydomonas incerta]|uniref:UvrD-like helicase C-terminal domain-containing protein n=1 Tax=Chlamydomonas incerta TaxID=51695 RepID=A0A835VT85_CHLIN|nr:hypothetical protein HXX76_014166 [Chlamydomonas incerta]|eukprot:KAG2425008.1 hypothetical protein HXX76_014166 [Chlamydomonas incerta]